MLIPTNTQVLHGLLTSALAQAPPYSQHSNQGASLNISCPSSAGNPRWLPSHSDQKPKYPSHQGPCMTCDICPPHLADLVSSYSNLLPPTPTLVHPYPRQPQCPPVCFQSARRVSCLGALRSLFTLVEALPGAPSLSCAPLNFTSPGRPSLTLLPKTHSVWCAVILHDRSPQVRIPVLCVFPFPSGRGRALRAGLAPALFTALCSFLRTVLASNRRSVNTWDA